MDGGIMNIAHFIRLVRASLERLPSDKLIVYEKIMEPVAIVPVMWVSLLILAEKCLMA